MANRPSSPNDLPQGFEQIRQKFDKSKVGPLFPKQNEGTRDPSAHRISDWVTKNGAVASHRADEAAAETLQHSARKESGGSAASAGRRSGDSDQDDLSNRRDLVSEFVDEAAGAKLTEKLSRFENKIKQLAEDASAKPVSSGKIDPRVRTGSLSSPYNSQGPQVTETTKQRTRSVTAANARQSLLTKELNSRAALQGRLTEGSGSSLAGLPEEQHTGREAADGDGESMGLEDLRRLLAQKEVQLQAERVRTKVLEKAAFIRSQAPERTHGAKPQPLEPQPVVISVRLWEKDELALQSALGSAISGFRSAEDKARALEQALGEAEAHDLALQAWQKRPPVVAEQV